MARTGRRRGGRGTRDTILEAARAAFARAGYDATSVRGIARDAGVDPALVLHYFGSKAQLFAAALRFPVDPVQIASRLEQVDPERRGAAFVRLFLDVWEVAENRGALEAMLRSAVTNEQAAAMLRDFLGRVMAGEVGSRLVDDNPLRPVLIGAQVAGLAMLRYIIRVEPLASCREEDLVAALAPTIQRYMTGDLPRPGPARSR
jgi:AcrR family transcriptional regulator